MFKILVAATLLATSAQAKVKVRPGEILEFGKNYRGVCLLQQLTDTHAIYSQYFADTVTGGKVEAVAMLREPGRKYGQGSLLYKDSPCGRYVGKQAFETDNGFDREIEVWKAVPCGKPDAKGPAKPAARQAGSMATEWDLKMAERKQTRLDLAKYQSHYSGVGRTEERLKVMVHLTRLNLVKFPDNGDAWFQLGLSLLEQAQLPSAKAASKPQLFDSAIEAFQKAEKHGYVPAPGMTPRGKIIEAQNIKKFGCFRPPCERKPQNDGPGAEIVY